MLRLKDVLKNEMIKDFYFCDKDGNVFGKSKTLKNDNGSYTIMLQNAKKLKVSKSTIIEAFSDNSEWREVELDDVKKGMYLVHSDGRIKNSKSGLIMLETVKDERSGRMKIQLQTDSGARKFYVSRVVATAWCLNDDPENKTEVDHIIPICAGGRNNAENLEWVTPDENRRRWLLYSSDRTSK